MLALAGVFTIVSKDSPTLNDITYDELRQAVEKAGIQLSAAELHGAISGLVCTSSDRNLNSLWRVLLEDQAPEGDLADMAVRIANQTASQLHERQMEFSPMLPDDDAALIDRAEELACWCQSFLAGMGASGNLNKDALGEQVGEIVLDFSRLAQAGFDEDDEDQDEAENAFAEILEFVRVGAQLIYEELAGSLDVPDAQTTLH